MTAVLYARVSTKDRQETANQTNQLREFCSRMGWTVVHEYVDKASGKNSDREQFQAMLAAASRREFDCVLFWSLDRFSREGTLKTLQHLQTLTSYGCEWKSLNEMYLDSTGFFKDAVVGIVAAIASHERDRLSQRVIAGMQRARKQGKSFGRPKKIVNVDRARELANEGMSYEKIGRKLHVSRMTIFRLLHGQLDAQIDQVMGAGD